MTEPARLDSDVGDAEHVCQEVRKLLMNMHSTLDRVRDISTPESMSTTMNGILEDLAVKKDGEDPLIVAVRRQVIDVYARVCSCRQCWASKCRGL
jgi:hypothetical protein